MKVFPHKSEPVSLEEEIIYSNMQILTASLGVLEQLALRPEISYGWCWPAAGWDQVLAQLAVGSSWFRGWR